MNKLKEARKLLKKQDKEWSIAIRKRDKKCMICGSKKFLNAHHLIPREIKEFRHDLRNGITLCAKHHKFSYQISAHKNALVFFKYLEDYHTKIIRDVCKMIKGARWQKC